MGKEREEIDERRKSELILETKAVFTPTIIKSKKMQSGPFIPGPEHRLSFGANSSYDSLPSVYFLAFISYFLQFRYFLQRDPLIFNFR